MTLPRPAMWELFDPSAGVFELRGIKKGLPTKTKLISWQHYPEDIDLAVMLDDFERTAMGWDAAGYNVYAVFNEIDEDFRGTSAKDIDIDARRYILIDIDRAAKADCPASDEEIQHAVDLSSLIKKCMSSYGWLEPLVVMSGNGVHLYYYLNYLPNTPELTEKIRELLQLLGDTFGNEYVKVDRSVYNASRITKVIGTTAKKGIEQLGRPYRKVEIISLPGKHGSRTPCFNTLFEDTLDALRVGMHSRPRPHVKNVKNFMCTKLDDTPNNRALVARLLYMISPDCDRDHWRPLVWAVLSTGITGAEELASAWSMLSDRYTDRDFNNLVRDYDPAIVGRGGQISIGTLYYYANQARTANRGL